MIKKIVNGHLKHGDINFIILQMYISQGLLGDKVINKYVPETISKIRIVRVSDNLEVVINDKEQILKLIDSLSSLQVKNYKKDIPQNDDETYYMWIYKGSDIRLGLTIYTVGYISVFEFNDKASNSECYKVIKDIDKLNINKYL